MATLNNIQKFDLPWLSAIDISAELEPFKERGVTQVYSKGDYIVFPGDTERSVFYLTSGITKLSSLNTQGEEKIIWFTPAPSMVAMAPFFDDTPKHAAVKAYTDCEGIWFAGKDFDHILQTNPAIYKSIVRALSKKVNAFLHQMSWMAFNSSEKIICSFLCSFAQEVQKHDCLISENPLTLQLNLTHQEISSITSVHRVTVTKTLSALKKQGIISLSSKGDLTIHDLHTLQIKAL